MSSPEPFLAAIQASLASGRGLPAECYRDPRFFDLEIAHLLRPGWHAVARWDALPEPGDYTSVDLCGEPLLIVRDAAAELRVFSRVCRHRAHTVVEGSGHTKRFVCPYHRWSYQLDGSLAAAPLMDGTPGFAREACGLPELRTTGWQGFLMVSLDPNAASLDLKALDEQLETHGFAELVTAGVIEFDSPWNWKVLVDNFMESYHHLGPHVDTLQKTNLAKETYCDETLAGPFSWLVNPGYKEAPTFYVAQVFPTLLLAIFEGIGTGVWYEMQIDRHDHFNLRVHLLTTPELAADDAVVKQIGEQTTKVHLEDIEVCDRVQQGLASRLWEPGVLSRHEGALTRFHHYLAERLGA